MSPGFSFSRDGAFKHQLNTAVSVGLVLFALISSLLTSLQGGHQIRQTLLDHGERIAENFANQSKLALVYSSEENAVEAVNTALSFPDVLRVEIHGANGRRLIVRGKGISEATDAPMADTPRHAYLETETADAWHFVAPVVSGSDDSPLEMTARKDEFLGFVRVVHGKRTLSLMLVRIFLINLAISMVFALLFLLGVRKLVSRITGPITQLSQAMARAERGDPNVCADVSGPKDIRDMATAFNRMIFALQERERTILQGETRYQSVVAVLAEGIVVSGKDGQVIAANESAQNILGLSLDQLQGRVPIDPSWRLVHEDGTALSGKTHPRSVTLRTGQPQSNVIMGVHISDDRLTWISVNSQPIFEPGEALPSSVVMSFADITERKRAEAELKSLNEVLEKRVQQRTLSLLLARDEALRANQAKSDFLSRMSHELRTPLNAVIGFGQLLESDSEHPMTASQLDNVHEILVGGHHLLQLINEVLDLSRIESGRLKLNLEAVPVESLMLACVRQIQPVATQRGISIGLTLESLQAVQADAMRLKQVVLNLLSNAIKYNREGGSVHLSTTSCKPQCLRISVRDTGRGIASDDLPRLFRTFERIESPHDTVEGSGIGLSLSRKLVEAMGGSIGVQSVLGDGSTFWFELPLASWDESVGNSGIESHE